MHPSQFTLSTGIYRSLSFPLFNYPSFLDRKPPPALFSLFCYLFFDPRCVGGEGITGIFALFSPFSPPPPLRDTARMHRSSGSGHSDSSPPPLRPPPLCLQLTTERYRCSAYTSASPPPLLPPPSPCLPYFPESRAFRVKFESRGPPPPLAPMGAASLNCYY